MKPLTIPLVLILWLGANTSEWMPTIASAASPPIVRVPLTVDAADVPQPALRHSLFHDLADQTPGNAAIAYARATRLMMQHPDWNDHSKQVTQWLNDPLAELPLNEVAAVLNQHRSALDQLMKATRHERCDWEIPVRLEGVVVMPLHLSEMRSAARLLALEIRLATRQGRVEDAVERLRAGLTLARHSGGGNLLIEGLVGVAITQQMLANMEDFIQQPGFPNLYWALTDLPPASLHVWDATLWERSLLYIHFPVLREIGKRPITVADLQQAFSRLQTFGESAPADGPVMTDKIAMAVAGAGWVAYPLAHQGLARQGMSAEQLRDLGASEALVRYVGDGYLRQRDNFFKWLALPYPQAREGMAKAGAEFEEAMVRDPIENLLARMLLPTLGRAFDRFAELDRQFAILRCIESIRFHAAQQNRQLPASLEEIEGLPVPLDPMTGRPFLYRLEGRTAILESPPVPGEAVRRAKVYEITIRP
jgi:hypothetical protein